MNREDEAMLIIQIPMVMTVSLIVVSSAVADLAPSSAKSVGVKGVVFQCRVFSIESNSRVYYLDGEELTELKFRASGRSEVTILPGSFPLLFYSAPDRGSTVPRPIARLGNRPSGSLPLLIFRPLRNSIENGDKYSVIVFDDNERLLPQSHIVFFNLSGFGLRCRVNGASFDLNDGSNSNSFFVNRRIVPEFTHAEGEIRIDSSTVECEPDERLLLFLLPPFIEGSAEVQYRLLRETVNRPRS